MIDRNFDVDADAIDLRLAVQRLWSRKWLILATTLCVGVIAAIGSLFIPNIYRAESLLAPNQSDGQSGLGALAGRYGALAGLAGINLNSDGVDKVALGLKTLQSRKFLIEFIERHSLLVPLMAAEDWDSATGELIINPSLYDETKNEWTREVSYPKTTIPSSQEAYSRLIALLAVTQDKEDGFVKLSLEFYSPVLAKEWLDYLVSDLNNFAQQRDISEAESAINYLNLQANQTPVAELRQVFFGLIEEQIKKAMLANVTDEYLFRVIDPAIVPQFKAKPRRSILVLLAMILTGIVVSALVLFLESSKSQRSDSVDES